MANESYIKLSEQDVLVRLIRLRNALGSARALAKRLDISESYLSDIFAGRRAIPDAAAEVVGAARVSYFEATQGWKP